MSVDWCEVGTLADFTQEFSHDEFHQVFGLWRCNLSEISLPSKENIDPTDMPKSLSRAFLYEYDDVTQNFYLRIAGQEVVSAHGGRHQRGAALEDNIPANLVDVTKSRWSFCIKKPAVMLIRREVEGVVYSERLVLPVVQSNIRFIFGVTIYQNPDGLDNPYRVDQLSRFAIALPVEKI